jgi:Bacterial PH domain
MFGGIPDPQRTLDPKKSVWTAVIVLSLVAGFFAVESYATPTVVPWSVNSGKLQIHSKVWNEDFPINELQLDRTRVLDLQQDPGWQPQRKSFGFSGFGFRAGRFTLQNGQSVDLYLAKETTAVLIPRRGKVPVMVGVDDPKALLAELQSAAAR